jgi:hypothetical protein
MTASCKVLVQEQLGILVTVQTPDSPSKTESYFLTSAKLNNADFHLLFIALDGVVGYNIS